MKVINFILTLACYCSPVLAYDHHEQEFARVFTAANDGASEEQYNLGLMYQMGKGVTASPEEAVKWWSKAVQKGHISALFNLGFMYQTGSGVEKNEAEAVRLWTKGALQGEPYCQYSLGFAYKLGQGVDLNNYEARKWFQEASYQHIPGAQFQLGLLYLQGLGVVRNESLAFDWLISAAQYGHACAQSLVAQMYEKGHGVEKDELEAFAWRFKAKEQDMLYTPSQLRNILEPARPKANPEVVRWTSEAARLIKTGAQLLGIIEYEKNPVEDEMYGWSNPDVPMAVNAYKGADYEQKH